MRSRILRIDVPLSFSLSFSIFMSSHLTKHNRERRSIKIAPEENHVEDRGRTAAGGGDSLKGGRVRFMSCGAL